MFCRSTSEEVWREDSWAVVFPRKRLLSHMVVFDFLFIDQNLAVFKGSGREHFCLGREQSVCIRRLLGACRVLDSFE